MTQRLHPQQIQSLLVEAEQAIAKGQLQQAESICRSVLATAPNNPLATHYLGAVAFSTGHHEAALQLLRRATELEPSVAAFFGTYAQALAQLNRLGDALVVVRQAVKLDPNNGAYQYQLGALAGKHGYVEESIAALKQATRLLPGFPGALNDLGITLTAARRIPESLDSFRQAIKLDPNYRTAYDNLIYYSHFASGIDGMEIRRLAEEWAARFAEPLTKQSAPHENDRDANRRLRIGFVSPDLWAHPVGRFLVPVFVHHDRQSFELFVYNDARENDAVTAHLRQACEHWRDTHAMSDDALASQIRADQIDILIDLSLHMGGNRLMLFARKPARVQVTYLGYAGTSGMRAMDWRISDRHLDPPENDRFYTERTWRLPRSYWCYSEPVFDDPLPSLQPRDPSSPIRFGALNNTIKMSDAALEAWAKIVAAVAGSTILIQAEPGQHENVMRGFFERRGVDPSRVEFVPKQTLLDYFRLYHRIDIALDTFPYAGGTTTCDALWIGVPVITLAGQIAVHRGGVSILTNVGLEEFIAHSVDDYVSKAIALANNPAKMAQLRANLRPLMQSSVLMNPKDFVADLQQALREIWKHWAQRPA